MKASRKAIESFLSTKKIAVAGVSRNTQKFGYSVFKELTEKGFDVYPVNPQIDKIGGIPCFQSVSALPPDIKNLLVVTPKAQTAGVVKEALSKGITGIWIQQMSDTPEALKIAGESNINLISKECILMWAEPVKSIHKFHRTVKRLFGMLQK